MPRTAARPYVRLCLVLAAACALPLSCAPRRDRIGGASPSPATTQAPIHSTDGRLPEVDEVKPLPVDPAFAIGTLDNGMRYYVRKNAKPEKRAEIWLAVNAGATLEDDDQRGLAHFVEHMAFNGTEHFKKQELVDYMEKIGMRFGADLNAFTSFDETIYQLKVPTDDPKIIATAFQILQDWASAVTFDDTEIDKERGVVIEEWRRGRGADARMLDKQLPVLFHGSRYAERNVIGNKEILETATHDAIRRYWRKWYRPELMAVVAVGDFDPKEIETAIRERFGAIPRTKDAKPREIFPVPDHDETLFSIASDPEATNTRVSIYYKLPKSEDKTTDDYRRFLVERLYQRMLNGRLDEKRQQPDPPFLFAFAGKGGFVRSKDVVFQTAAVKQDGLARGLDALLVEVARVERHGFLESELDRAKTEMLRGYEQSYKERDKEESDSFAGDAVGNFLNGEAIPGIEAELALVRRFLPTITLAETNDLAKAMIPSKNRVILVNLPEKAGVAVPTEAEVQGIFTAAQKKTIEPYVDQVRQGPLVTTPPKAGSVVEERTIPEVGVTWWRLSNGAEVVLKPTDFKNDQILLTGFSPGGHSLVGDDDYISAAFASAVLPEGGLGSFSKIELRKALAGKVASASSFVGELEEGVRGSASPQDLETMFQLLYLDFTAPRKDEEAFRSWKERTKGALENRLSQPETVFSDRFLTELTRGHVRRRPPTVETLSRIDLDKAMSIYRDRFADAGDFTFVLVGNFQVETIRPAVLTWLGGLPATRRKETWRDVGVRPPDGVVTFEVKKGIEPKAQVRLTYVGTAEWSRQSEHDVDSLVAALRIRLREVLREDMGGVYGVGVFGSIARRPLPQYNVGITFGCAPERVDDLKRAVSDVVAAFQKGDIEDGIVEKVKEQQTRERETDVRENDFWLGELADSYRYGTDPLLILSYDELVKSVSNDRIAAAAKRYLDASHYLIGTLEPEAPAH